MQIMRIGPYGEEIPAVRDRGGIVHDARPVTADIDGPFLAGDGVRRLREALDTDSLPRLEPGERIGAPIARPMAVVCIGQNYAAHAAESGNAPPSSPILFLKHPNTVVGPYDDIVIPRGATKVDWEVELGVVVGRAAEYVDGPEEALACVAGYVVSHDVSERAFQLERSGGQWSKGKCAPTFNPVGPWLVPAGELSPQELELWSTVNGEPRQASSTADMIFSAAYLIHHISQYMRLEPGDLVNTGTPQGVALSGRFPYLKVGDVVEMGIDGLGSQRSNVVG
ncbi:fumarylacetoacetate hydrolase family protein [Georgenia sp. AZ-5]|uniref:fumarylacetoacetate hydrolase family protein n=1 Tax=Georgenia sp. AZ-5 TaxID=3367526 RepID=UPI00375421C0